jgi:DNA-binding protein Fis
MRSKEELKLKYDKMLEKIVVNFTVEETLETDISQILMKIRYDLLEETVKNYMVDLNGKELEEIFKFHKNVIEEKKTIVQKPDTEVKKPKKKASRKKSK